MGWVAAGRGGLGGVRPVFPVGLGSVGLGWVGLSKLGVLLARAEG